MNRLLWASCALLVSYVVSGCSGDDDTGSGGSDGGPGATGGVGASSGSGGTGATVTGGNGGTSGNGGSAASGGAGGGAYGGNAGAGGSAGDGGSAGSGGNAGVAGAAGGGNQKTCEMLNDDYVTAIGASKKCVYGTSPNPCTSKIKSDLECQCPTYVNPANAAALAELAAIEATWTAKGCVANPGCLCADPAGGACYAGPGGPANGICQDG